MPSRGGGGGGTEPFTPQRYKEELGKSYNRITLYLCKKTAILDALFLKSYDSDKSEVTLICLLTKRYKHFNYCFRLQVIVLWYQWVMVFD